MTKHVKRNSSKPSKLSVWLGKALASDPRRPVLTHAHKTEGYTEVSDGYRIHRTTEENDYELGLTPTKKSKVLREGTNFPPTDAIFPKRYDDISQVKTVDLINALQRAMVFSKDNADFITIKSGHVHNKQYDVSIIGKSAERGDCDTGLDALSDGLRHPEYQMSGKYMLDALSGMKDCETVTLKYDGYRLLIEGGERQALIMGAR